MYALETIRRFNTKNFTVVVEALEETELDLSWDDTGEVKAQLDEGQLVAFLARVRVLFHGQEIGVDYLGNCIYKTFGEFMDHKECGKLNREYEKQGSSARCGSYFRDMVSEAIREARKALAQYQAIRVRSQE